MDKKIEELVKRLIKDELGELVSAELELRFKPIGKQIETIQKGQDEIVEQLREDRKDINQIKIGQAKSERQNAVIIDTQDKQEEKIVEAVKEQVDKIPGEIEQGIEKMFDQRSFLKKLVERFTKKGGK